MVLIIVLSKYDRLCKGLDLRFFNELRKVCFLGLVKFTMLLLFRIRRVFILVLVLCLSCGVISYILYIYVIHIHFDIDYITYYIIYTKYIDINS